MSDLTNYNDVVENIVTGLALLKNVHNVDGIKVYFQDDKHYVFKLIKDDKIFKVIRCRSNSFDNKR